MILNEFQEKIFGKILFKDGNLMTHSTGFDIEFNGIRGHGFTPEKQ